MSQTSHLTMGPILFHWAEDVWRDFYFCLADEAPVDTVYIGEVVCSKRAPFHVPAYAAVARRLRSAGKTVVFSTLAEVTVALDRRTVKDVCAMKEDFEVEANDASALWHLSSHPHRVGPFVNVYNEDTLDVLADRGARHFCLSPELPGPALGVLAQKAAARSVGVEVQIYGRIPLALSARCYHARAVDRVKDNCRFACEKDPDGMALRTLDGTPFLTVNGIQTLSHDCLNLAHEIEDLRAAGLSCFRLSPHAHDMTSVARLFRALLDGEKSPEDVTKTLAESGLPAPFSNGFYHKTEGYRWNVA